MKYIEPIKLTFKSPPKITPKIEVKIISHPVVVYGDPKIINRFVDTEGKK